MSLESGYVDKLVRRRGNMSYLKHTALLLGCFVGGHIGFGQEASPEVLYLDKPTHGSQELVLAEGSQLIAKSTLGEVRIIAGLGTRRIYVWDNGACQREAQLWRREERWYGSYGIYFPGPGNHWPVCNGIRRGVLEEGQLHFSTLDKAQEWVDQEKASCVSGAGAVCDLIYSADGLVLRFGKTAPRSQLDVTLFQLYVDGFKPQGLEGASTNLTIGSMP
jgi:hypothetical protein